MTLRPALLGGLFLCLFGCSGGGTYSGGEQSLHHPNLDKAIAIIQSDSEISDYVLRWEIFITKDRPYGHVCAAPSGGIVAWYDYIANNPVSYTVACLCHEARHLNERHGSSRSTAEETDAKRYASYCVNKLGLSI